MTVANCIYRFYGDEATSTNEGYRAAGYTFELRDTGDYGFELPPDQVREVLCVFILLCAQ